MRNGGWKPFWASLGAALLVLLPLVGGTVLLSRQQLTRQLRQAAQSQSGVPVHTADAEDRMAVLVCTVPEQPEGLPGFVLIELDAAARHIAVLSIPAQLQVEFAQAQTSLAECYRAAGPARCRQALAQGMPLPEDTHYLALSAAVLQTIADRYGALRVSLTGALTAEELERCGQSGAVQAMLAADVQRLLSALDADTAVQPQHTAAVRATVWDAFFRQSIELLPATLPAALRRESSGFLTDLTALDYAELERILEFLANGPVTVEAYALPVQGGSD